MKASPVFLTIIVLFFVSFSFSPYARAESGYSLQKAAEAAVKVLNGRTQFAFFNLPEPKGDPSTLLKHLDQALGAKVPLVIAAPKLEYIRDLLTATMKKAGKRKFDGLLLVVIGPKKDDEMFAALVKESGFKIICGAYD